MTRINLTELMADREAGTPGPWRRYKDGIHPVLDDGSNGNESHAICGEVYGPDAVFNSRRIARLPDLEAAYIEAVRVIEWIADQYEPGADAIIARAARKFLGDE